MMEQCYALRRDDKTNANTNTLRGLKDGIRPKINQTYAATWLRERAPRVGGGLLSDEPGLGKVSLDGNASEAC